MNRRTAIGLLTVAAGARIAVSQTDKKIRANCWAGRTSSGVDRFIPCGEADVTQAIWAELNVDIWKGIRITKGEKIIEISMEEVWNALSHTA